MSNHAAHRRNFSSRHAREYRQASRDYGKARDYATSIGVHGRLAVGALVVAAGVWWQWGLGRALVVFGLLIFGTAALELAGILWVMMRSADD